MVPQKSVPFVNKDNAEMSALVEKTRYFWKPETGPNVLDPFRAKYGECHRNMGVCKKESVFQHFHTYFCILSSF